MKRSVFALLGLAAAAAFAAGAGFTHPLTLRAWAALAQAVRQ